MSGMRSSDEDGGSEVDAWFPSRGSNSSACLKFSRTLLLMNSLALFSSFSELWSSLLYFPTSSLSAPSFPSRWYRPTLSASASKLLSRTIWMVFDLLIVVSRAAVGKAMGCSSSLKCNLRRLVDVTGRFPGQVICEQKTAQRSLTLCSPLITTVFDSRNA
jgi:hypothetical protein